MLAWLDLMKQIKLNNLKIIACASFTLTYDMLLKYYPVLDFTKKTMMPIELKEKIINCDNLEDLKKIYSLVNKGKVIRYTDSDNFVF